MVTTILFWITLAVVAVVVLTLAYYLLGIIAALRRANANLEKLAGGLQAIQRNAEPLAADLATINGAAVKLRDGLAGVERNLRR
jgi:hypothetical protein